MLMLSSLTMNVLFNIVYVFASHKKLTGIPILLSRIFLFLYVVFIVRHVLSMISIGRKNHCLVDYNCLMIEITVKIHIHILSPLLCHQYMMETFLTLLFFHYGILQKC